MWVWRGVGEECFVEQRGGKKTQVFNSIIFSAAVTRYREQ